MILFSTIIFLLVLNLKSSHKLSAYLFFLPDFANFATLFLASKVNLLLLIFLKKEYLRYIFRELAKVLFQLNEPAFPW